MKNKLGERVQPLVARCCGGCWVWSCKCVVRGRPVHYAKININDWLYKYLDIIIFNFRFVIVNLHFEALTGVIFPDFVLLLLNQNVATGDLIPKMHCLIFIPFCNFQVTFPASLQFFFPKLFILWSFFLSIHYLSVHYNGLRSYFSVSR